MPRAARRGPAPAGARRAAATVSLWAADRPQPRQARPPRERGGRQAGQFGALAGQVRLVGVSHLVREPRQVARARVETADDMPEPQHPLKRLRPVTGRGMAPPNFPAGRLLRNMTGAAR